MIRRLRLRNWRSYEQLELSLDEGTTFVVAPNGVGKTSLVLGLAWAVFGDDCDVDPRSCIRAGANAGEVEVELVLPDGRELSIVRQVKRRGRPTVGYSLDGTQVDHRAASRALESGLAIDLRVAARLSMMLGGSHLAARNELDLESHLHTAFGVSDLLANAKQAQAVAKEAEKARSALRESTQGRVTDRADLEAEIERLEESSRARQARGLELENQRVMADRARVIVERQSRYEEQHRRYEQAISDVLTEARDALSVDDDADPTLVSLTEQLRFEREVTESQARAAAESYATAKGAISASEEGLQLLSCAHAQCPTCMRPIASKELGAARAAHERRARAANAEANTHSDAERQHRSRSAAISALLTRLELLESPALPEPADGRIDAAAAAAAYSAALEALEAYNQEVGAVTARIADLRVQLATDARLADDQEQLRLAYRREAVTQAAAKALQEAANQITAERIEPIASEVQWRWKRLFGNGGLRLQPDGAIVREEAGQVLGWDTLSGGERVWARIVTHLLVVGASTNLPFVWFDEPLEHLDPQLRQAVAATLATTTQSGAPRQLLVTTYEQTIARQLAEDTPGASLITLRASDPRPGRGTAPGGSRRRPYIPPENSKQHQAS